MVLAQYTHPNIGAEAEHQLPKRIMQFGCKRVFRTSLGHWINIVSKDVGDPCSFLAVHLAEPVKEWDVDGINLGNLGEFIEIFTIKYFSLSLRNI